MTPLGLWIIQNAALHPTVLAFGQLAWLANRQLGGSRQVAGDLRVQFNISRDNLHLADGDMQSRGDDVRSFPLAILSWLHSLAASLLCATETVDNFSCNWTHI